MHFCLLRAEQSLLAITGGNLSTFRTKAEQRIGRLRSELDYLHIDEIIENACTNSSTDSARAQRGGEAISKPFLPMSPSESNRRSGPRQGARHPDV